ncbi:PhoPQ-activated protein PqaA family protein [Pseudothermotoga lettingae]|jgi:PhoPQ-activated pathogenicity-related protein|uniref:PhoPQ-activated pathogenicity-related protein PqaA type n=1 Tax=Pseudothermotoga lettingae (strain ATCC BAA-301 / DSM 14385 / NBRC 107922 / TMO) TaxID=416591 RepID=A8F5N9_PSELT|nr:PhoPQ-activated protein PqaA family protein [Pseudothermotoga lettingae]ABV33473.1 conserved hypothetical protein [Pseudothermotoga lettingae TMO]GLI49613.1 PhoPQ-activated pathogenicity protein [Pseudothermotoga lettingae TMO]
MKKTLVFFLLTVSVIIHSQNLADYVLTHKNIDYKIVSQKITETGVEFTHIVFESQTWQGIKWFHDLLIVRPAQLQFSNVAILMITGDFDPSKSKEIEDYLWIAEKFQALFVVLGDVPNQPIYGLREDDLIAYTFVQYSKIKDASLPLLFPMTASAVSAMDLIQQLFHIEKFFVTGASKRGWTTWLTAAVDKRVFAIAPIVFDNLNFQKQLQKQLEMYGQYSASINPYVKRGVPDMINTQHGQELLKMVDPYFYIEKLDMPKYIINATNDEYWTIYSANLYFFDLIGKNYLLYVPNNSHGIKNIPYVVDNASSFFKLALSDKLPEFAFELEGDTVLIKESEFIKEVYLHRAISDTTDFRKSLWLRLPVLPSNGCYSINVEPPEFRHVAYYAEVVFEIEELRVSFCTPALYK